LKKFIIGFIILMVVLVIGLVALPSLIPSSVYKENIETQLTRELARDVRVKGDVRLTVFPVIKANTGRVEIDNPDGFKADNFAEMDAMSARVKLFPLFSKRVEIASFTLKNPSINLEKLSDGTTNWAFGETEEAAPSESGAFKRDGRYNTVDPKIGKFTLENGAITYIDRQAGTDMAITNANVDFSLPSLSEPVSIDGSLTYDSTPAEIDLTLSTIRDFLDGKEAPVSLTMKTDFADIAAKGRFLPGPDIAFNLDVDGDVSSVAKLASLAPQEVPYADMVSSAKLSGNYAYDGTILSAKGANISAIGQDFTAAFKGDATLAETPIFNGRVELDAQNLAALAGKLDQDIKGISLLETVNLSADLIARDKGFDASNISASVKGDNLDGSFTGTGIYGEALSVDGDFSANVGSIAAVISALEMDMPQVKVIESLVASGKLSLKGETISLSNLEAKTQGDINSTYAGTAAFGDALSANGTFTADIASIANVVSALELDIPQAKAIENLNASGTISMAGETIRLSGLKAKTEGSIVSGSYQGGVSLGDVPAFDGSFDVILSSLSNFANVTATDIAYAETIGRIAVNGTVSGQGENITLPTLTASLSNGQINGRYEGTAKWDKGATLDGNLNVDIPSLRNVAKATGTELPSSTATGPIFERFTVNGTVKGTPDNIQFNQAALVMDAINGKGDFAVNMTAAKPFVTGIMDLDGLDLSPYMAAYSAQNPTGEIQPWSTAPINTAPLRTVDGDFTLNTPNIKTDRLTMGQSKISAKLRGGVMTANMPNIALYGGLGRMIATLDGSQSVPSVSLDIGLDDLNSNSFLASAAGFTQAEGELGSSFKITGSGTSQAAIMKSLNGVGDFKLIDGLIKGVDLSALLKGIDQALTSRSIPSGIGPSHITKFNDLAGLVKIENGVASINKFSLQGLGVLAEGSGQIDLGNQTIDFGLRPRLTGETASNIAAFGIPIEIKGGFGSAKVGLDTDMLGQIAAERARAKAGSLIKDQVGGTVGDILGGVIGGTTPTSPEPTPAGTETPTTTEPKKTEEVVGDILGGLLGGNKAPAETPTQSPPSEEVKPEDTKTEEATPKVEEPSVEDALLSIFGSKKKKDSTE